MLNQLETRLFGGPVDQGINPRLTAQSKMHGPIREEAFMFVVNHWPAYSLPLLF